MAAITGLAIVYGQDAKAPSGYVLIDKDLNEGAGGDYVYLCYSTVPDIGPPITAIQISASKQDLSKDPSLTPTGYTLIPDDLNKNAGLYYIYMSYAVGTTSRPITGLDVISSKYDRNIWPASDYIKIDQGCNGIWNDTQGYNVYVCYR